MQEFTFHVPDEADITELAVRAANPLADRVAALEAKVAALTPAPTPAPVPTRSMTRDLPAGYTERIAVDFGKQSDCPQGAIMQRLALLRIGMYPENYTDTSGRGKYGPYARIVDGQLETQCFVDVGGIPRVTCLVPLMFPGNGTTWGATDKAIIWEECSSFELVGDSFKAAHMLWPNLGHNRPWTDAAGVRQPGRGELDNLEFDRTTKVTGYIHEAGMGGAQTSHPSGQLCTDEHVWRGQWIPGQSVQYWCDGVSYAATTVNVSTDAQRPAFQNETSLARDPLTKQYLPIKPSDTLTCRTRWIRILTK